MAEENKRHSILMEDRKKVNLTGVTDVLSFDEECVVADTTDGAVVLKGRDLHVSNLNLDKGELFVDGDFTGIVYEDIPAAKTSLFGRIFK